MRVLSLRMLLCLTLTALATSTAFAGVRGKATKLKEPAPAASAAGRRIAQNDVDYGVNSVPHPVDPAITNETVIQETTINPTTTITQDPNCVTPAPTTRANPMVMPMPVPVPVMMPMMAPAAPMLVGAGCATCGGLGYGYGPGPGYGYGTGYGYANYGLSPATASVYGQAFGPGLYRSGAEAGQYHFPYYSYRRPWYFPGQPSFHRSTDYVW